MTNAMMSAKGYTHVIMVLNMRRFVHPDDRERFETVRGTPQFAEFLRSTWKEKSHHQNIFAQIQEHVDQEAPVGSLPIEDYMAPEEIGFATGVFRSLMIERFATPTYALNKNKVQFSEALCSNFQFKTLFLKAWERWQIYIRPTFAGFFVIRLTQLYQSRPRSFLSIAKDVMKLQESLDVVSAQRWLTHNRLRYLDNPETLAEKERSVRHLLAWMGAKEDDNNALLYYPVQWKLAMEVAGRFIKTFGPTMDVPGYGTFKLENPEPNISLPLHDSYVIHHFNEILADPAEVRRAKAPENRKALIPVNVHDIREAPRLKRSLMNLIEGSILREHEADGNSENNDGFYFPEPRWSISDALDETNQASWNDELCLLAGRTAILAPSQNWRKQELAVSTVPSATLRVKYIRYWDAIERMVEFILEIRVLAQLVESLSYDLLSRIIGAVHTTRNKLLSGDIQMDGSLPTLIEQAAHLRRLTALVQSLSHPLLWSRAEYTIQKADHLFNQLGVNKTIDHIQRNIESINSVVDHIDELYLADLSEKNNDKATILSIGLAAASLTLTILMLPSFWTDLPLWENLSLTGPYSLPALVFAIMGSLVALGLMSFALYLLFITFRRRKEMQALFKRFINGTPKD